MHELALTRQMVEIVESQAQGARVLRVVLEIGSLTAVLPDAVRFCFDVAARGTLVEGALLEIQEIPARGTCRSCGSSVSPEGPVGYCDCGGLDIDWLQGRELRVREMEIV